MTDLHYNMTLFYKVFTTRNRNNKTDNGLKLAIEPLCLRSSSFHITKEQIRVVLFRECERRGRKLLFDSNSIEKLQLEPQVNATNFVCQTKCDKMNYGKFFDFVEVTNSHGYKYKKPCGDVTLLGEMIFGSVAMVFKGESTSKIHSLTSPRCVMFTNIVHAPQQCHYQLSSEHCINASSGKNSLTSISEYSAENRTSSSDSKLYEHKQLPECNTSTFPSIKHKSYQKKIQCCCEADCCNLQLGNISTFHKSMNANSLEKMCLDVSSNCDRTCKKMCDPQVFLESSEMIALQKNNRSDCKCDFMDNLGCFSKYYECNRDNFSSVDCLNSSLSSLRRRWMQSCSSSVDEACYEETNKLKNKTRTKLGIGLVVDLTNNSQEELEKFLFDHTIVVESILNRLQSSVENAYIRKENFVDLTYSAFINCQQSIYELIMGGKYARPMWLTLAGGTVEEYELSGKMCDNIQDNNKNSKQLDALSNIKLKFLNDFCDVLVKFDTKDTNFFISTLLTAVLTHHLSWVTGIAESDVSVPQHHLQSVIKGLRSYNPIRAQMNDLNGILGSPLKSAKTVITGSENNKNNISCIIQILTYFIRCYDILENLYDFDIKEIFPIDENLLHGKDMEVSENFDCSLDSLNAYAFNTKKTEDETENKSKSSTNKNKKTNSVENIEVAIAAIDNVQLNQPQIDEKTMEISCHSEGLRRTKSFACQLQKESVLNSTKIYPSVDDLTKLENVHISDVKCFDKNEKSVANSFGNADDYDTKIDKLIGVPRKTLVSHMEQNFSPDEGYDTINSCTMSDVYTQKTVNECIEKSKKKEDVLFILGENEELVNLKKVVVMNSSVINIENKDSKDLSVDYSSKTIVHSDAVDIPVSISKEVTDKRFRTFKNNSKDIDCRTIFVENGEMEKKHFSTHDEDEANRNIFSIFTELPMPRVSHKKYAKRRLDICSVLGSVNEHYNSEQIIQGVLENKSHWEKILQKDLILYAHNPVLDRNITEALCIIGDMNSWEVSLYSSHNFTIDKSNVAGIRIGMSKLVADMLESLLYICRIKLPPEFCLSHIEKKLHEIYSKSKSVAELLNSTEMCSIEYLTSRLDISVNDVPLLLSVATTHSPHISSKYGLTFT